MKKHIFGFGLFSLIVTGFVLAFTFFYAPSMPSHEAVKAPLSQTETREEKPYSCQFRKNKYSVEVLSSQYFVSEQKIVSKIRLDWNGNSSAPEQISVGAMFNSAVSGDSLSGTFQNIQNPFGEGREKIVTVVSPVSNSDGIKLDENLYMTASVNDYDGLQRPQVSEAKAILFVFDEKSIIKR